MLPLGRSEGEVRLRRGPLCKGLRYPAKDISSWGFFQGQRGPLTDGE